MRTRSILAVLALVALPLAACGDDDDPVLGDGTTTTAPGDDGDAIASFTIVGTDYAFDAPADLTGGTVEITFDNQGSEMHEAWFLGVSQGTTVDELIEAMPAVFEGGPIPDEWEVATGISEVEPGESVTSTITLPEGDYFLVCTIPEGTTSPEDFDEGPAEDGDEPPAMHIELGMHEAVEITEANDADLPEADGRVTIRDYDFDLPDVTPGAHELSVVNAGQEFHHVLLFEWPEEVETEEQAEEAFQAMAEAEDGPPPEGAVFPDEAGGSFVFSPGQGGTFEATFQSGRWYTAICFIHDRAGGPPHAFAHDMYRHFEVQ